MRDYVVFWNIFFEWFGGNTRSHKILRLVSQKFFIDDPEQKRPIVPVVGIFFLENIWHYIAIFRSISITNKWWFSVSKNNPSLLKMCTCTHSGFFFQNSFLLYFKILRSPKSVQVILFGISLEPFLQTRKEFIQL